MLRLFIKDNTNGEVHEYGESCHDALILQEDGSLHYENMQNCCGSKFPEEGYSFCLADGTAPPFNDPEQEPYVDIGGEYYTQPQTNGDRIRAMSDEELAQWIAEAQIGAIADAMNLLRLPYNAGDKILEIGKIEALEWLKRPAED